MRRVCAGRWSGTPTRQLRRHGTAQAATTAAAPTSSAISRTSSSSSLPPGPTTCASRTRAAR
eukprot:2007122-Pleurochrysis_carterae.AAC.3